MTLHPERYSTSNVSARKRGVVIHDAESGDTAYPALLRFLSLPGDRVITGSNPPRKYGSGYHAITDGAGGYTQVASATTGPYHAPPLNKTWWSICMPGRANQTREQWTDELSRAHIRGVARFIVDKAAVDGFPLERCHSIDLLAGDGGYTSHADVSAAWGQTNHTDPGLNFPWDLLAANITTLTAPPTPPKEDGMRYLHVYVPNDPTRAEALVMMHMIGFVNPAERDAIVHGLDADKVPVTATQYDTLLAVYTA